MDSLFSKIKSAATASDNQPEKQEQDGVQAPSSAGELFSSSKVLGEAAQNMCNNQSDKVDKTKVADAGEDLLNAASEYGNLQENKTYGQYVDKAQDYLHNYGSTDSKTTTKSDSAPKREDEAVTKDDDINDSALEPDDEDVTKDVSDSALERDEDAVTKESDSAPERDYEAVTKDASDSAPGDKW